MATITFEHVTKVFDDKTTAVDDLSLSVADGEFLVPQPEGRILMSSV